MVSGNAEPTLSLGYKCGKQKYARAKTNNHILIIGNKLSSTCYYERVIGQKQIIYIDFMRHSNLVVRKTVEDVSSRSLFKDGHWCSKKCVKRISVQLRGGPSDKMTEQPAAQAKCQEKETK